MQVQPIQFHYLVDSFFFPERTRLKNFILQRLKKEGKKVDTINYIFCSDDYLLELHKKHLNHNTYTDIITFELSEKEQLLVSDIYISIDRVRENAKSFSTSFQNELHRVIFHGALHLAGYKDKSEKDSALMRQMEDKWLKLYRSM
jgi:probable rRNA maturation factor